MGFYKHLQETFQGEYKNRSPLYRQRISAWRKTPAIVRSERPTNLARARSLGYKAKQGIIIVRVRIDKGMRKRKRPALGRKPSKYGQFYSPSKSHQFKAEQRAASKFRALEVLNSYFVGSDGDTLFFEVIMFDPVLIKTSASHASGRAFRGLTSQGKRSRGLRNKGKGAEKLR